MSDNGVSIPPERARAAAEVAAVFAPGRRVVLTTHVNADGDGVGSEVALWHLLTARGLRVTIANPTPIPERFHFLLPEGADHSDRAAREIAEADVVVVLDISEVSRLGDLARAITQSHAVACIDHHVSVGSLPRGGPRAVRGHPHRHGRVPVREHHPARAAGRGHSARARRGPGDDLRVGVRERARGSCPPHGGGPQHAGGRTGAPAGPPVPPTRQWQGQGQLPLARRRGRGRAGAAIWRWGTPQSRGGVARGLARRGARRGAGSGAAVSQRALAVRRNARTKFRFEKSPPVHTRHKRSLPGSARAMAASLHPRPCSSWIRSPSSTRKSSLSRSRAAPCSTRPRCWQNSTRGSSASTRRNESIIAYTSSSARR